MRMHGSTIARRGKLLVALPLAFQVIVLIALAAVVRSYSEAARMHASEQVVIASTYRLLSLLVDAETGSRGYMLTTDRRFTEPYERALREIPAELAGLQQVAPDQAAALRARVQRLLIYHRTNLQMFDRGSRAEALAIVRRGTGKALMDAFRRDVDGFVTRYRVSAAERERSASRSMNLLLGAMAAAFVVNVVLALAMSAYFSRSIAGRIGVVRENVERFEHGRPLRAAQGGDDEIAQLDHGFHTMAAALTAGRTLLERANAELESFSYSVSHDLRAPVRALNGYARILEEDYGTTLDAEGRRIMAVIRSEAERLGALIDDLLSFSRLGQSPLRATTADMSNLVTEVAREVLPAGAQLSVAPLPPARGDRTMLRHVLVNLLSNAVKFSAPRPPVRIEVFAEPGEQQHVYAVRDHGVGYDPRYAAKLFGVFQRLHSESEFEGTGVGLAIVKRVIERHGGRVWSESSLGNGSTFFFTLPAPEREGSA